ncbi:MAG: hypothetical protein ABIK77_00565 [candidate division WOR-3 bacterium]|nr:hypothetical protein [Candidatus Omnitrophota bacterium]
MNGNNKKLTLIVRRLKTNPPIIISCDIKPVEIYDYKGCLKDMEYFAVNLVKFADVSFAVLLIKELYKRLLSMFQFDAGKLIKELEEKEKGVGGSNTGYVSGI